MITSAKELEIAVQNLHSVENALDALRNEMQGTDPALFPIVSQTYTRRIHSLREDISAYWKKNRVPSPM